MALGGARPGAGRKAHLEDKTAEQIVRMSAMTILRALRDKSLDISVRADLAKHFVLRAMPQKIESNGALAQIVQVYVPLNEPEESRHISLEAPQRPPDLLSSE